MRTALLDYNSALTMDVGCFIAEMESFGVVFELEAQRDAAIAVALWYPSFAIQDLLEEHVALLRRHRGEVIAFLSARPAWPPAALAAIGGNVIPDELDPPEDPTRSEDFPGDLHLPERVVELAAQGGRVPSTRNFLE